LTVCLIIGGTGWGTIYAGEMAQEEQIASEPPAFHEGQMPQAGPEQLDRMLEEIRKTNPQQADELAKLRQENPEAFRAELRKAMRERFAQRMKEQMGEPEGRRMRGQQPMMTPGDNPKGKRPGEGAWIGHGGPEMMREWMEKGHEEYIKWLESNYPDEAAKLKQLKEENPDQYARAVMASGRKYWPIFFASKDNPQLAKVLKEQLAMKEDRNIILRRISQTTDEKEKKELTAELEKIVGRQFDLIVTKKQLAYEDLAKKLEDLKKELEHKKAEVEKWKGKDFKNDQVQKRVNELLSQTEKFEWEN
jgi:hypothetical protein